MNLSISMEACQWLILPAAFALDVVVGDPRALPHPIRWMGRAIAWAEPVFRKHVRHERLAGSVFALTLILGAWLSAAVAVHIFHQIHFAAGVAMEVLLIFFSLSARSLCAAGMEIHQLLNQGRVDTARSKLALIVGRDVHRYDKADIARATVETVAENYVDGVLAPLFFAVIGGAPLAMAYKMINTLDSMVGYKNPRYRRFGWAAARIDDLANFLPARLSVAVVALTARFLCAASGRQAWATALKEGARHSSPNAGYSEAAFAGALGVKLNGPNHYGGLLVDKPYIGTAFGAANIHHIQKACELLMLASVFSAAIAWIVSIAMTWG